LEGFHGQIYLSLKKFYLFYNQVFEFIQQVAGQITDPNIQQVAGHLEISQPVSRQLSYPAI
jgi:hypothetical protein